MFMIEEDSEKRNGGHDMIYADNAATTKMSQTAADAMLSCMGEAWGNASSLYKFGQKTAHDGKTRQAAFFNCRYLYITA